MSAQVVRSTTGIVYVHSHFTGNDPASPTSRAHFNGSTRLNTEHQTILMLQFLQQ